MKLRRESPTCQVSVVAVALGFRHDNFQVGVAQAPAAPYDLS